MTPEPASQVGPEAGQGAEQVTSAPGAAPAAAPSAAPRTRRAPDLSALYADIDASPRQDASESRAPAPPRPDLLSSPDRESEDEAEGDLVIPAELERYVSPDLWRRLNGANPQRGLLINALDRVRSVLNLLATFLPQHLVQEKMRRPVAGLVSGQMLSGTLLFSDVSGFTALSERLQSQGPMGAERLTGIMNHYFSRMIEIIAWSGGTLLKFAGDATLVYFPAQRNQAQANWAVRAGQRMLRAIAAFSNDLPDARFVPGGVSLKMKIGVATGEFLAASLGSESRMEYVVLGPAVAQTLAAEGASTAAGQLVIDAATRAALDAGTAVSDHKAGFSLVAGAQAQALDDFEIRAETRRARGAVPWSASPHALIAQIEVAMRQIAAILPYLPPEVVDRAVVRGQRTQFASQYRPTTVIFCNFWGYEALMAAWGAEGTQRVTGLLNAYFTAINAVITRYGGIISRIDPYSRGTKILILFGAPVAHEDDPQRAISAALSMNAELEALNDTWRRKLARHLPADTSGPLYVSDPLYVSGPLLQHRIGVTTGMTYAGQVGSPTRREYTVMGDDVNLSARLMAAAEPGQILVHFPPEVKELVSDSFHLAPLAPIRVKGKSKPIAIEQVLRVRENPLRLRMDRRSRLVGRSAELAQAEQALARAMSGNCTLLALRGPAGIGKSHLADELLARAEKRGTRVLFAPCRAHTAQAPYAIWSHLLRCLAGITASDDQPETHRNKLRQMVQGLELEEGCEQPLGILMGLKSGPRPCEATGGPLPADDLLSSVRHARRSGSRLDFLDQLDAGEQSESGQVWLPIPNQLAGRERERVYQAVADLLRGAARAAPLVIFFEDAHWMDHPSGDLLKFIVERGAGLPLLFLLAQRGAPDAEMAGIGQVIELEAFTPRETAELVAALLVDDLAPLIQEQSNGNPLFVEEITRWFRRTRKIHAGELRGVLQSSNVLQKLVLSRLENLPEDQREVALSAAVIGMEFRTGEVQALIQPEVDPVTLSLRLRGLARAGLIDLLEAGADARYAFQQALVRDVIYQSLPFERRRALHARLAQYLDRPLDRRRALHARLAAAIQRDPAPDAGMRSERIASHYELAEAWMAAARSLAQAGDQARERGDLQQAAQIYARALADLEKIPDGSQQDEAAALKEKLQISQGDAALRTDDYLTAAALYEAAGSSSSGVPLAYRLALALPHLKRAEEGESLLRRALDASAVPPEPEFLLALAWLAARHARPDQSERIEICREALAQAAPHAHGDWTAEAEALLLDLAGAWDAARAAYRQVKRPLEAGWLALRAGQACLAAGDVPAARAWYEKAADDLADGEEEALLRALVAYRQAELQAREGNPEQARAALETARTGLAGAPPVLAAEGQLAIQQALKSLGRARPGKKAWPAWRAQAFEDRLRLRQIFRA